MMNDVRRYATTTDQVEARELLQLLVASFMLSYFEEREAFAKRNDVEVEFVYDGSMETEYALYIQDLLIGMRERTQEKMNGLSGLGRVAYFLALYHFVDIAFRTIFDTEQKNLRQLAELNVAQSLIDSGKPVSIYKRWVAHESDGACDICSALDGTVLPIDEPFLVNGQIIQLGNGTEFIYKFIDRYAAVAHPNCRCEIETIIEF